MTPKRILFITQAITPFVDETETSLWGRKAPQYVQERGSEIRVFMPKWGTINERRCQLHEVKRLSGMNLIIDDTDHLLIIKGPSIQSARMPVYFIDNDECFMKRLEVCDAAGQEYSDNAERAVFYARGIVETVKKMRWNPDVVICQGWASVVAPLLVKVAFREELSFRDSKVVFTPSAPDVLKLKTRPQFRKDILFKNVKPEMLEAYPETLSIRDLYHLAIDYSDALFFTPESADDELAAYAASKGVPACGPFDIYANGLEGLYEIFDKLG